MLHISKTERNYTIAFIIFYLLAVVTSILVQLTDSIAGLSSVMYSFFVIAWGASVFLRIVHKRIRRDIIAISVFLFGLFIEQENAAEGRTVLKRNYGKETSYGAAELTEAEKNDIIKQEEEQRKRAAEIRRIREEVIPLMPTDKLAPRQDIHRVGTKMYEERKASLKAIKQHGPPYLTISDDEVLELVNRYKGTGEIKLSKRSGKWDNEETILTNDTVVGIAVNNLNGKTAGTTVFRIHYSKNGVHIVPDYPSKKRKVKKK